MKKSKKIYLAKFTNSFNTFEFSDSESDYECNRGDEVLKYLLEDPIMKRCFKLQKIDIF